MDDNTRDHLMFLKGMRVPTAEDLMIEYEEAQEAEALRLKEIKENMTPVVETDPLIIAFNLHREEIAKIGLEVWLKDYLGPKDRKIVTMWMEGETAVEIAKQIPLARTQCQRRYKKSLRILRIKLLGLPDKLPPTT